jgi:hypothetical protein
MIKSVGCLSHWITMNPGLLCGIIGSLIGLAGGVCGAWASARRVSSAKERRYVIWSSIAFLVGISLYLTAMFVVPHRYHPFLQVAYAVALPFAVLGTIRGHARIAAESTHQSNDDNHVH